MGHWISPDIGFKIDDDMTLTDIVTESVETRSIGTDPPIWSNRNGDPKRISVRHVRMQREIGRCNMIGDVIAAVVAAADDGRGGVNVVAGVGVNGTESRLIYTAQR